MKLQRGVLLTVLGLHSSAIEAGHHDKSGKGGYSVADMSKGSKSVYVEHVDSMIETEMHMYSKTGKADGVEMANIPKSGKYVKYVHEDDDMSMAETDDHMSVVYVTGKAHKAIDGKASKTELIMIEHESDDDEVVMGELDGMIPVHYASKSGKAEEAKSGKGELIMIEHESDDEMSMAESDDMVHVYYANKSGKAEESKAGKAELIMIERESDDDMSMAESDDMVHVYYTSKSGKAHETKAGKAELVMIERESDDEMSMSESDDTVHVYYTSKSGKAHETKAGKADAGKAGKSEYIYIYGKSGKSSGKATYSMSMEDDDPDGEWVPVTTEPAITTAGSGSTEDATVPSGGGAASTTTPGSNAGTTAAPGGTTAAPGTGTAGTNAATTAAATTTAQIQTTMGATTTAPLGMKPDLSERLSDIFEDELMLIKEGHHGGEGHVHQKSEVDTVEISNRIASGTHLRPDAIQQSDSTSLSVSRYSIAAVCLASLYALSL